MPRHVHVFSFAGTCFLHPLLYVFVRERCTVYATGRSLRINWFSRIWKRWKMLIRFDVVRWCLLADRRLDNRVLVTLINQICRRWKAAIPATPAIDEEPANNQQQKICSNWWNNFQQKQHQLFLLLPCIAISGSIRAWLDDMRTARTWNDMCVCGRACSMLFCRRDAAGLCLSTTSTWLTANA